MTAVMIALIVIGGSAGDVFVTKSMKQLGEISTLHPLALARIAGRTLANPPFLAGLACMGVSFVSLLIVLSWADLSFVLPATSIGFVATAFGAKWTLKERISPLRWTGIALVCAGVALVSLP